MYQRVTFYSDAGLHRKVNCYFISKRSLERFLKIAESVDHTTMIYDLWGEKNIPDFDYPIIPANGRGFTAIMRTLYP